MSRFVPFDDVWPKILNLLTALGSDQRSLSELWFVRDLMGRIRVLVPEEDADSQTSGDLREDVHALSRLADVLHSDLGNRSFAGSESILKLPRVELDALQTSSARKVVFGDMTAFLVDRLVTGGEWATVSQTSRSRPTRRFTLFSIKGGVGRTTTAAALAAYLARQGRRVLIVDLDLESPSISSVLLDRDKHPEYGVVDWFVEDLVDQGEIILPRMVGRPAWSQSLLGDVLVAPAHGSQPGEYVAKLGRVYVDLPGGVAGRTWTARLARMLDALEEQEKPDVVLLDSRSGLHDIAAAAVTDIAADVLLFALESEATWAGYRTLFDHWRRHDAARPIRERLSLVAAFVPTDGREKKYLSRVRERAWALFSEELYDEVPAGDSAREFEDLFSFSLVDDEAPHNPMPIYWSEGLYALPSLVDFPETAMNLAYKRFFERFELLMQCPAGE